MDVIKRIEELQKERGWTEYRLAREAGLAQSTIANIFHRHTVPSIRTLETICDTFGITLSQFFSDGKEVSLSKEQSELLSAWSRLNPEQKSSLLKMMKTM